VGDSAAGASALRWSITAMSEAAERLPRAGVWDRSRALGVIGEMVWWVTIVDATLVRYHAGAYDRVLAGRAPAERHLTEATLTGLRFVRNRIGHGADLSEFVAPGAPGPGAGQGLITDWRWKPVPRPVLTSLSPRGRAWETMRYQEYRAQLAGRTIGEIFGRATAFLELAAADASAVTEMSAHAASREVPLLLGPAARTESLAR
jgi:hypothetical protein